MKTPRFWYPASHPNRAVDSLLMLVLTPLSLIWRGLAWAKARFSRPYHPEVDVVVVGNLTAGGTGKTPLVAALVAATAKARPVILTRGHGGRVTGPHLAQARDTAADIGDEAQWLTAHAPVVVARHRGEGVRWIETHCPDCRLVIMDDGLQNPTIAPKIRLAVFSGALGVGNGRMIPAGPMREDLGAGLARVDGVIITGTDKTGLTARLAAAGVTVPVFTAPRALDPNALALLKGPVVAFAGIGHPQGFFDMLSAAGVDVVAARPFPDHHRFTAGEITALKGEAQAKGARLVTTEKDMTRLSGEDRDGVLALPLTTRLDPGLMDILPETR